MIQSMTGYGKSTVQLESGNLTIEIKSLNSKNIDLNTRITNSVRPKELLIRKYLSEKLKRGKVEFLLYMESSNNNKTSLLNSTLINTYIDQLREIVDGSPVELLKIAVKMPDTIISEQAEENDADWPKIFKEIENATESIIEYRKDEGSVLEKDFIMRIHKIKDLLSENEKIDTTRINHIRTKIKEELEKLKIDHDSNRFEQELIYYIEKIDITEEKVRLDNHLNYFLSSLENSNSNGKKLSFIGQEIGREINTIGSKANNSEMQKIVIQMKDELEKIKEQLLNVL
ncbi:YicC family protein [Flavobacteriaceae bacterium]|nr:YicC family protein [Flavobacteriaceae bacterium]MDB9712575.1 YicC family protein [Flavobacteriaceae bacterium]MDC1492115.1 YicC family protein [Flavobacteriaceae bacterium]MDC1534945.1 YicC family protein [Flavobacteriaceae bacterium]